jgi:hypothetical protein
LGFNSWIDPLPAKQHGFLVLNFINLAILVRKKMEKWCKFKEKCKQQKACQELEIKNLKKMLLMNTNF